MTPLEVAAAIGAVAVPSIIPTIAVVISIIRSDSKIDALSARMDTRIDVLSSRMDALGNRLDSKIDTKIDALGTRLDAKIDSKIDGLRSDMRGDMRVLDGIGYTHHGRLTRLEMKADEKQ